MIPVSPKTEPSRFDAAVRKPACLGELHHAYSGVCAYLCVFIERSTGGSSVDHYIAKSRKAELAYEWSNYRLASTTMNSRKRDFSTVLDPFQLQPDTFRLELVTGRLYPNPGLPTKDRTRAQQTIDHLQLDDATCREMRARRFDDYIATRGPSRNSALEARLKRYFPFIESEAARQGVL